MASAPIFALACVLLLAVLQPGSLPLALPLLIAWALAPEIAYRIGQPLRHTPEPLTAEQNAALHSLARRTWLFFEDFVGPEDHWLPPITSRNRHAASWPRIHLPPISASTAFHAGAYDLGYIASLSL